MKNLFDLTGKMALLVGYEGNLGPIWRDTLEAAGASVEGMGLPVFDFSDFPHFALLMQNMQERPENMAPDIIVCNAAIDTPPTDPDARFFDDFEETMQVNVNAHARIIERYLPGMVKNGGGVIVFIGSIMGFRAADWTNYSGGFEKPVAYNVSKAALVHLAACITRQYGHKGIRAVCPSFGPYISGKLPEEFLAKITNKIPMRRTVLKESLQRALLFSCCCEDFAGGAVVIDGGLIT